MSTKSINQTTQTLISDFDYFKSPAHYITDSEGKYTMVNVGCCNFRFLSYLAEKITLVFRKVLHCILSFGNCQNDATLWNRNRDRIFEINNNREEISALERKELTRIHQELRARQEGKITQEAVYIFQKEDDKPVDNSKNLLTQIDDLKRQVENLEKEKKEYAKNTKNLEQAEKDLKDKETELLKFKSEIETYKQDHTTLSESEQQELANLRQTLQEKEDAISKLHGEVDTHKQKELDALKKLKEKNDELILPKSPESKNLTLTDAEKIRKLEIKLKNAIEENKEVVKHVDELQDKEEALEKELNDQKNLVAAQKKTLTEQEIKIKELEAALQKQLKENTKIEFKVEESTEYKQLLGQLNDLKKDLEVGNSLQKQMMTRLALQHDISKLSKIRDIEPGDLLTINGKKELHITRDDEKSGGLLSLFQKPAYKEPSLRTLESIATSFDQVVSSFQELDKTLSLKQKNEILDAAKKDLITLASIQNKLNKLIASSKDEALKKQLSQINDKRLQVDNVIQKWGKDHYDNLEHKDISALFEEPDTELLEHYIEKKLLKEDGVLKWLNDNTKKFTESTNPNDFMWKTSVIDEFIYLMQQEVGAQLNEAASQGERIGEKFSLRTASQKIDTSTDMGMALASMSKALIEIKIDPTNPPHDHQTLDYQKRIRHLSHHFFEELTAATELALKVSVKKESSEIEKKYADAVLKICTFFFNGINLKKSNTEAVNAFYKLVLLKGKGLLTAIDETFDSIAKSSQSKKTTLQNYWIQNFIGHVNIGFNPWSMNPVQQWFTLKFPGHNIDFLAFGSPTNESSPKEATIIPQFKAAMKQYANDKVKHLYVSFQNFIPVNKQKEAIFNKLPKMFWGVSETVLGDETNRCNALKDFEESEDGRALYFMALSKNSAFYKHPSKMDKETDLLEDSATFKKELFHQIFEGAPEETGNYISKKIKDAYKKATTQDIDAWGKKMIDNIHRALFHAENSKDGQKKLNVNERKVFIEILYYFLTMEIAQKLPKIKSMNTSCKDNIDRGNLFSMEIVGAMGVINDLESDDSFVQQFMTKLFSRALVVRQREPVESRVDDLKEVMKFVIAHKKEMKQLHKDTWNALPQAMML